MLFKGPDEAVVDACSKDFAEKLKPQLPPTVRVGGPAPAPLAKAKNHFRAQLLLFAPSAKECGAVLRNFLKAYKPPKGVTLHATVDALSLM